MRKHTVIHPLVCLHSSASSPRQWSALSDWSGKTIRVTAPPLLGYGSNGQPTTGMTLRRQVARIHETIRQFDRPVHLVGHSFGGAVAMRYALMYGHRLASLQVYEPVLFDLLFSAQAPRELAHQAWDLGTGIIDNVRAGRLDVAAQSFIEYWNGGRSWTNMSPQQQSRLALQMPKVAWEFKACFNDCPDPAEYASLHLPVQILCGTKSPAPVRWIGTKLSDLVPGAIVNKLVGLDHMAPVHSPAAINPLLLKFVRGVAPGTFGKSRAA